MPKTDIGSAMFYPVGSNPYDRDTENPYRIGDGRKAALAAFRTTGELPKGFALWDDRDRVDITSPDRIEWGV